MQKLIQEFCLWILLSLLVFSPSIGADDSCYFMRKESPRINGALDFETHSLSRILCLERQEGVCVRAQFVKEYYHEDHLINSDLIFDEELSAEQLGSLLSMLRPREVIRRQDFRRCIHWGVDATCASGGRLYLWALTIPADIISLPLQPIVYAGALMVNRIKVRKMKRVLKNFIWGGECDGPVRFRSRVRVYLEGTFEAIYE